MDAAAIYVVRDQQRSVDAFADIRRSPAVAMPQFWTKYME
jgi:hypothetical protein